METKLDEFMNNPKTILYLDVKFSLFLIKQEILHKKNFAILVTLVDFHFKEYPTKSREFILDILSEFSNHWHLIDDETTINSIVQFLLD